MILNANQELFIRIIAFIGVLLIMLAWEYLAPRRRPGMTALARRGNNFLLVLFNIIMVRLILPLTAVGVAELSVYGGWGLLNIYAINLPLGMIISLVVFDFALYIQHVLQHRTPLLWYLHRVHHIDQDVDVTTAFRLHPFEVALAAFIRISAVLMLGAPALAVMIFEVLLNACTMFNHGNISIPRIFDRWLRWIIVTPDMHRVHHSVYRDELDSNYGFILPWWDRLFHTYRPQPRDGHTRMHVGLSEFSGKITVNFMWLLFNPFLNSEEINRKMGNSV